MFPRVFGRALQAAPPFVRARAARETAATRAIDITTGADRTDASDTETGSSRRLKMALRAAQTPWPGLARACYAVCAGFRVTLQASAAAASRRAAARRKGAPGRCQPSPGAMDRAKACVKSARTEQSRQRHDAGVGALQLALLGDADEAAHDAHRGGAGEAPQRHHRDAGPERRCRWWRGRRSRSRSRRTAGRRSARVRSPNRSTAGRIRPACTMPDATPTAASVSPMVALSQP